MLSLFPGMDLLGAAFEREGFCVVRGPDKLWGGDICDFHPPAGVFDGIIGGPPCQKFSRANRINGSPGIDLIPEFIRVVREAEPQWLIMENVEGARHHGEIPREWWPAVTRDWDCGGETYRKRYFWTWPFALLQPPKRRGARLHTASWRRRHDAEGDYRCTTLGASASRPCPVTCPSASTSVCREHTG